MSPFVGDFGGLSVDGNNHLFVTISGGFYTGVLEYDATTGALNNNFSITDFGGGLPGSLFYVAPVPEPSSLLLLTAAATAAGLYRRRIRRQPRSGDRQ